MTEEFESFDQIKEKIKNDFLRYQKSAKTYIPKCVDALKVEQPERTKDEIKDIILKEFLQYWSRKTIMDSLGEEYKDEKQVEAGKKGSEKKKEIVVAQQNNDRSSTSDDDNRAEIISAKNSQQTVKENENITTNDDEDDLQKKIPPERDPVIQPTDEFKDAESVEDLRGNKTELVPDNIPPYIKLKLDQFETTEQLLKESLAKISELENKLQDHAFDEIKNSSKDSIKTGIYDLEIKDKIIPLKWNYAPTINRMVIELDVNRARRMGI